ncbi:MAG: T9SS type A sorting domain-containing protein [Candidatus Kapabacteria bacterium]|nr:T9SS type A sorting domain-containing protein [Candidatus Kapabacteria bacterium]
MFNSSTVYSINNLSRTIRFFLFVSTLLTLSFGNLYSQARIGSTDYSTLKAAFDAINAGTHTGDIVITIRSNLTETSAAVLQASGVGSANYNSVTIYPTGTYTISGSIANGLIELRGADNVTIDGRVNQSGSTNALTIQNTYTSTSTVIWLDSNTTSTIANGAKNNTIRNCNIVGSNVSSSWGITCGSSASLSTGGVGMDNNRFLYNNFSNVYYAIRIYGTGTAITGKNKNFEISYNTATGSIMYYFMYIYYADGFTVSNNYLNNHTTGSVLYYLYSYYGTNAKIYGNSATNLTAASSFYGIYNYYGSYTEIYDNTFDNITSASTVYALYNYYSNKTLVYNNIVQNLNVNGTCYAMYHYYCDTSRIYLNTIQNITALYTMYGIYSYSAYTLYERNLINSLKSTSTGGYAAVGIYMAGSTSTAGNYDTLRNNVIYKMTSTNYSSTSLVYNPFGILIASGLGHKIWHNSINLYGQQEGSNTSGTLSAAFCISGSSSNAFDIRNNVFSNSLVGLTGSQSYAIYLYGTTNLTNTTINYNDYYASGTYGVLGYLGGNRTTIAAWRSATSQDANSFSSNPNYNADDFLIPLPGSPLVGAGTPLTEVPRDFLNANRSTTAPTVGAYEQSGEFAPPRIEFTPLANTTSTSNRVLNNFARITDNSGVNTTTYAPRLYYKKSTDANTYTGNTSANNGWKYVVGTNSGDMFSFTIDYSKLQGGSVQANDEIQYFIVAQDLVSPPNVGINSGKFNSKPSNVDLGTSAFPITGTILSYRISPSISGTIRVGSSETYKSLTKTDGLFAYMNNAVLTGNVTILITSSITDETGAVGLKEIAAEGGNPYTITIRPVSATNFTISGSSSTSLIRLEGADRVTIDGSFNNAGRYLTFINTSTSSSIATIHVASFTGGANNNTIKNCNISTGSNTTTNFAIYVADNAISTSGAGNDNDNLTIDNNVITRAYYGIYVGGNASVRTDNLVISRNIIGSNTASDYINIRGIFVQNADYAHIRDNEVFNMRVAPSTNISAIEISGTNYYCEIYRNKIYAIKNPNSGGWGAFGINVASSSTYYLKIYNNFIWDITTMNYSNSSTTYNPFGIRLTGGQYFSIYHNTVHLYGTQDNVGSAASLTACFLVTSSSVTSIDLRNNIFANGLSSNISGTKSYTVYVYNASPSGQFNNMDYNVHYAYGSYGILAGYNTTSPPTDISDLATLRSIYGRNTNTKVRTVTFVANNDLHLDGDNVGHSDFYAPALGIGNDIDLENRRTTNCYVGADEVNSILGIKTNITATPNLPVYCSNSSNVVLSFEPEVKGFVDGVKRSVNPVFTYDWYKNNQRFDTRTSLSFIPVVQSDSANYYVITTFDGSQVQSDVKLIRVETAMSVTRHPNSAEVCSNDPSLTLQGGGAGTILGYQWQKERKASPGTFDDIVGQNSPTLQLTLANALEAAGAYRLKIIGPGNCGPREIFTNVAYVNVSDPITWVRNHASTNIASVCVGDKFDISVTSDGTVLGYMWQKLETGSWKDLPLNKYPSATSNKLVFKGADPSESGNYRCIIFGSPYCNPSQAISETFAIKIFPEASFTFQPQSQQVCVGANVVLTAYTDAQTFSYQWQKDGVDLTVDRFPTAKSPILYLNNLNFASSGVYRCIINVEDCKGIRDIISNEALIYVHSKTEIISKPTTIYKPLGDVAQFEVRAHVELIDNKNYDIQWWRGNTKIRDNDRIAGANSSILTIRDLQPSDYGNDYWVMVTGLCGADSMKYITLETPDIKILNNPQNVVSCEYKDISFSVDAIAFGGANITYQWFRGSNPLTDGQKYSGSKSKTLTIKNVTIDDEGDDYFVRITLHPYNITINSDNVSLDIKQNLFYLTQLPENLSVKVGDELKLVFEVVGEAPITYQWFKNGNLLPNFTENTLLIPNSAFVDAGVYKCVATNECGTLTSKECTVAITTFIVTSVDENQSSLDFGNTPNPTSGATTIFFNTNDEVLTKIVLRDLMGREIQTLFNGLSKVGYNEIKFNPSEINLSAGVYYYTITLGEKSATKPMVIVK